MKILYGVQATGNGHITRARAMHKALSQQGSQVDYLFSGRQRQDLFDMEAFGDFACHPGLTFVTASGAIQPIATYRQNRIGTLLRDIKELDLSPYDLILTDFEPISAWAAHRQKKTAIAIGHQYAFDHTIPKRGNNPLSALFMRHFTPATLRLGLHWHHFNQPILPPIADTHQQELTVIPNKILVYLGFEDTESVIAYLRPFQEHQFFIYAPISAAQDRGNIQLRPLSRSGFQEDLASCNGVISNAGFELASEAIHLGKKLLVKPLKGQMEQLSNAAALEQLTLGMTMDSLDNIVLQHWLKDFQGKRIIYPSVPAALAQWLAQGQWQRSDSLDKELIKPLWEQVQSADIANVA